MCEEGNIHRVGGVPALIRRSIMEIRIMMETRTAAAEKGRGSRTDKGEKECLAVCVCA